MADERSHRRRHRGERDPDAPPEERFDVHGPAGAIPVVAQGSGRTIVIVHGGTGDVNAWAAVADILAASFRVLRYTRPTYRLTPAPRGEEAALLEVAEAHTVAKWAGDPVVLVGHSSGAVVALETVVADPRPFAALVCYEPPLGVTRSPEGADALRRARQTLDAGDPVGAMRIHLTDLVGMPRLAVTGLLALPPARHLFALFADGQIADNEMLDTVPEDLARYGAIELPVLLVTGAKSPAHLRERSTRLAEHLPVPPHTAELHGQSHGANMDGPDVLAAAISAFVTGLLL